MERTLKTFLITFGTVAAAAAQSAAPFLAPAASTTAPSAAPSTPAVTEPDHVSNRSVSSGVAAMLSAGMPAYNPPKPEPKPKEDEPLVDMRDIDKPKAHIIRLPKYVVHAEKPHIFKENELYSKDGLARLAMMRYSGLNIGPASDLNQGVALQMYRDEERLKNIASLNDTADAIGRGGDKIEADAIRDAAQSTYQRTPDFSGPVPQNPSAYGRVGGP